MDGLYDAIPDGLRALIAISLLHCNKPTLGALRADREVVQAAVKEDGQALKYASDELKKEVGSDKGYLMAAPR